MNLWPLSLVFLFGCAPMVKELKKPPFPYAATHHARVVGIKLAYQGYGLQLGFCSETLTLLPCSTNSMYAAPVSDRFKVGQSGFDTTITEEINAGWKDQPPTPMLRLPALTQEHPRSAVIGALDSAAPVFALQFSETERRPTAVLELNADDAFNTYSVIGTINYTNSPPSPPK